MLRLLTLLALPSLLLAGPLTNSPQNPWGEYAPTCRADEPSLWDEKRIEQKWYVIDLDKEPHERWAEVAADYKDKMSAAIEVVRTMVDSFGGDGAWDALLAIFEGTADMLTEPYKSEIHAMTELTGVPLNQLMLLNLFYEIEAACTSLVAMDEKGNTYHGRNLDFGLWMVWNPTEHTWELTRKLQDLVAQYQFYKDGKLLFKGVGFGGHLGLLTAVRPGAFSISINTRFGNAMETVSNFFNNGLLPNQQFILYVTRDVMTNYATWQEAKNYIETVQLLAPCYYTMGTIEGGMVVTRSVTGYDHEAIIDPKEPNGWYVLETNYDWDKPDIIFDDRTKPGNKCMQQMGRKRLTKEALFNVMSSKQNLNKSTIYTVIMEIKTGALYTFIQKCEDPCWLVMLVLALLLLPSLLLAAPYSPQNPWGEYAPTCLADEPSLWDEKRIEQKWYVIDLDKEPHERWAEVAKDYTPKMQAVVDVVQTMVESFGGPNSWDALIDLFEGTVDFLTEPYRSEVKAIADLTGYPVNYVMLLNLFYEIEAACTSVVAIDEKGNTYHGRNLDFGLWMVWDKDRHTWKLTEALQDIVAQFEYHKDGKLLFKAVGFAGHLGLLTAVRPGAFSVSINTRFGDAMNTVANFFANGLLPNQQFILYAARDMMTNCATWDEAKNYIETVQLLAPVYYTMGSTNGGMVVTRSITTFDHEAVIDTKQPNGWFVLECNYDWDKPDIILDDRTQPGKKCMQQMGRKRLTKEALFNVMSSKQNLNKSTIYTVIMAIKTGELYTFKQTCPDPCWMV